MGELSRVACQPSHRGDREGESRAGKVKRRQLHVQNKEKRADKRHYPLHVHIPPPFTPLKLQPTRGFSQGKNLLNQRPKEAYQSLLQERTSQFGHMSQLMDHTPLLSVWGRSVGGNQQTGRTGTLAMGAFRLGGGLCTG